MRAAIIIALLLPVSVAAGYRELEALLVRVDTTDDKASRSCWRTVHAAFAADGAHLRTQSRARMAKSLGVDDFTGMTGWPDDTLGKLRAENDGLDAVVLVRCDAPTRTIEIALAAGTDPGAPRYGRLLLSGEPVDRQNAKLMARLAVRAAYAGFEL